MNIHQLLSASQSSPQTQSQGAFSRPDSASGLFGQALLKASDAQRLSAPMGSANDAASTRSLQTPLMALNALLSGALSVDAEELKTALESLGLDISEGDLSELFAQLQQPAAGNSETIPALNDGVAPTQLDDIAARLALMASFSDATPQQAQSEVSLAPALLESIAEQLDISQTEAAQLVSALNGLVNQQPTPADPAKSMAGDMSRITVTMPTIDVQTAQRQTANTFFTQVNTAGATSQISSDALMGALLTADGTMKGNTSNEHLLTGLALNGSSHPSALAQPAAGLTPTTPTQATLATPVTSSAWPQQLGQQLVQISQRGGDQLVQLHLNPAELGPLSISLKFGDQGAQAHFLSAHAQVRQVLEQAIPQLREALAEQGISLGETSVGEQRDPNAQAFAQSGGNQNAEGSQGGDDNASDDALSRVADRSPLILDGRVDLYA
ncbi:flagellar hook-length control protein FliK [Vreelandella sulfidaeris]|uniref:flagellar hook-length control protein FliK n=1 Tax=Vreelandella sulfidaeris TaxID=115553 RepID=UPI0035E52356